jgi:hypothetical protein
MKNSILITTLLFSGLVQLHGQGIVSNGDFSAYSNCSMNCNITTYGNAGSSNLTGWYANSGTPEIYAWIQSVFMWDGMTTIQSGSNEAIIQVLPAPVVAGSYYFFSIDAFKNNNRGTGGMIAELEDASGSRFTILNTAVTNSSMQTFSISFPAGQGYTKLIVRPKATSGVMDLVIDNVQLVLRGATGVDGKVKASEKEITKAWPNPFTHNLSIEYSVNVRSEVTIELYDITGRKVQTLQQPQVQAAGKYILNADEGSLPPAVYFLKIKMGDAVVNQRIIKQ